MLYRIKMKCLVLSGSLKGLKVHEEFTTATNFPVKGQVIKAFHGMSYKVVEVSKKPLT